MIIFSCTEEAIAYGNRPLSKKVIKHLKDSESEFRSFYMTAYQKAKKSFDISQFNQAMVFATKAQFCREALEINNKYMRGTYDYEGVVMD